MSVPNLKMVVLVVLQNFLNNYRKVHHYRLRKNNYMSKDFISYHTDMVSNK